jgi:hypothetical protein
MVTNACIGRKRERASGLKSVTCAALGTLWLLAAACTPGRTQAAPSPADDLSMRVSKCGAEALAEPLPPVTALLDSAALTGQIARLLDAAQLKHGEAVLTLWYQPDGVNLRRDLLAHAMSPILADSVQKLVFASLRTAPPRERAWGARLQVQAAGGEARYTLMPREHCPPRPRSLDMEAEMASFLGSGVRYRGGTRERVVVMQVTVHPLGYVTDAKLVRGDLSGGGTEIRLREYLRQFSFEPASIDGVPVQGQLLVPVRVRA